VIAGSYALFQFTGATSWKPDDVDIMIGCLSKQEFEMEAEKFEIKSKVKLTKFSWFDDKNKGPVPADAELFHDKV